jgi:hypothetical protein
MTPQIEAVEYAGWQERYRISNGITELILTGEIGPRIMHYGFEGGQNFLAVSPDEAGKSGEGKWQARGGHRLWIAPEDPIRSYAPDNSRVSVATSGDLVECTGPVEALTGLEKQIAIRMHPGTPTVEVRHRIRNAGREPCRFSGTGNVGATGNAWSRRIRRAHRELEPAPGHRHRSLDG